ncbi:hypothetical protein VZT92_009624 [Zoarces viviparus]|uniref:Uncharacterized protein n=1 Tax=Zoarces viviparus TaxID=48416 RepID=A0AAW1FCX4_ZOAVI
MDNMDRAPNFQDIESPENDPSGSTIQRRRRDIQLLRAELEDRDRDLNTTTASCNQQLQGWEEDRQRALSLEQRGAAAATLGEMSSSVSNGRSSCLVKIWLQQREDQLLLQLNLERSAKTPRERSRQGTPDSCLSSFVSQSGRVEVRLCGQPLTSASTITTITTITTISTSQPRWRSLMMPSSDTPPKACSLLKSATWTA